MASATTHRSDGRLPQFKANIVKKRNDTKVNNHQRIQLQGFRANCNIQVVIDQYACIEYLSKYAAKAEPKSPMLAETFDRHFSAQETMHLLLSLKLYSTTFKILPVSLYGSRSINPYQHNASAPCSKDSQLNLSVKRIPYVKDFPDIKKIRLVEFIERYRLVKGKLVNQSSLMVPRVFPHYSPNPESKFYSLFCKYQLLKF